MVNASTQQWIDKLKKPVVASSIPAPTTTVQQPTPVTYAQQTDPSKAKISSIDTSKPIYGGTTATPTSTTTPTQTTQPTPTSTTTPTQTTQPTPAMTAEQNDASRQQAYEFIGAPKTPVTPPSTTSTGTTTPTTQPTQPTTEVPGTSTEEERVGQSRTEEQQLQADIDRTQEELMNLKNRDDALSQAEYLKKTKELQEYQAKQKEITDKQRALTEEQAQIQSSAKLREAQRSLSQLKRNTAYLNSQGLGQSAEALDAFGQQLSNAEQTFKEMQQYEQYAEEMRKLGYEFDANAYERSMKEQQDEIDKYVSDTIQTIFNNMSAAEMAGQMDTVDEVDAFAQKYFNAIDTDIANMTRKQIAIAEQKLLGQQETLKNVRDFVAKKATINQEMSTARGYYVDGNGTPLISSTGGVIPTPVDPPKEPIYDEKTGQLISFSLGENGQIVADVQQVIDMPTFGASTISNMAKAVANGTMTVAQALDVLPVASQQAFLDQIGSIQPVAKDKDIQTVTFPDGTKQSGVFDPVTGEFTPIQPAGYTPNGTPISEAIKLAIEKNKTGAQCGRFVNDILQNMGLPRLVGDSYQSKEMAVSQIGIATTYNDMGAGSIFAYPVKGSSYGHIGIVTGVNDDGTIDIMDYNYKGDQQRRERNNVDPSEIVNMGGMISKPIIRDDTVPEAQKTETSPYLQAFNSIVFDKPTTEKNELEKIKGMIENGNVNQAKMKLETLATQGMGAEAKNKYDATKIIVKSLSNVKNTLAQMQALGVDTGLLKGKYEGLVNKFGATQNPELARLGVLLKDQLDEIRRARSGAALTEFEEKFYDSIFPSNEKNYNLNIATIEGLLNSREMLFNSYLKNAYGDDLFNSIRGGGGQQNTTQSTTVSTKAKSILDKYTK